MSELGDDKPSALMSKMLALIDDHDLCILFCAIFLRRPPDNICIVLASSQETDLWKLSLEADKLIQAQRRCDSTVQRRSSGPAKASKRKHQRGPSRSSNPAYCSYHNWFCAATRNCTLPCAHLSAKPPAQQQGNEPAGRHLVL